MEKNELNEKIESLNEELSEFQINQLEERLETDPLMIGNALDASVQLMDASEDIEPRWCIINVCNGENK